MLTQIGGVYSEGDRVYAMKTCGQVEVRIQSFLTSTLDVHD
jgi:hypothetical protein